MKRDFDLIRAILLSVEAAEPGANVKNSGIDAPGKDSVAVSEHVELLTKSGFLEATISQEIAPQGPRSFFIWGITWHGYEYLDSIQDPNVWLKTKQKMAQVGGSASMEMVKTIASQVVKDMLGM